MASRLEQTLAARLREIARAKKMPLSHVADRAGIARSYFWRLLDGSSSATLDVLQRLAEALGVPPLELLAIQDGAGARASAQPKAGTASKRKARPSRAS